VADQTSLESDKCLWFLKLNKYAQPQVCFFNHIIALIGRKYIKWYLFLLSIYVQRQLLVREFLISMYNIFVQDMNLQDVCIIENVKQETIVVINGSGGSIKIHLLFLIVKLCNTS
jgi:hypothetical protein